MMADTNKYTGASFILLGLISRKAMHLACWKVLTALPAGAELALEDYTKLKDSISLCCDPTATLTDLQ